MNSKVQKIEPPPPPAPRVWTSLDLIKWTSDFFTRKGLESPRLEAELLLAHVLGLPRIQLYVNFEKPVAQNHLDAFRELVKRRGEKREPLQYLTGSTAFIELKLKVTPAVLIPRPETEQLALWAVERLKEKSGELLNVVDVGTGSGCLALYIAKHEPRAKVFATDLSAEALEVARENAAALGLAERVTFLNGDLFEALPAELKERIDLLVSNPPYIDPAQGDGLQPEVRDHEPQQALFAPEQGLAVVRRIVAEAPQWLSSESWLGLEFGKDQHERVRSFAEAQPGSWKQLEIRPDHLKVQRFLAAQRA